MDGVHSFEQRSLTDFDGRGNRVIVVCKRDPALDWQITNDTSLRLPKINDAPDQGDCCNYFPGCGRLCSALFCCFTGRSKSTSEGEIADRSVSRGKRKRKLSEVSTLSQSSFLSSSFDYGPFPSNVWKTSKYTIINFLPKNLFEQFRRIANFYFLITAILQAIIPDSPIGPSTSLIPLAFVVSTTAIKQAYEDYLRHKLDNEVNNRVCCVMRKNKRIINVRSKDIRVGDIVYVRNNEEIPCDMILLASSGANDRCYITTANLDGEASLKSRTCFQLHQQVGDIEKLHDSLLVLECEKPSATLYEFNGFLRAPKDQAANERLKADVKYLDELRHLNKSSSKSNNVWGISLQKRLSIISTIFQRIKRSRIHKNFSSDQVKGANAIIEGTRSSDYVEIPLDISSLLLRASRLRNTKFIYGLAIYTGPDTRLAHNSQVKPNKFSSLETRVNMFLAIAFLLLILLTLISAIRFKQPEEWYLKKFNKSTSFLEILTGHFVLYNYLVPISLYVTLEFVKFLGTISVLDDEKLQAHAWTTVSINDEPNEKNNNFPSKSPHQQEHASKQIYKKIKKLQGPQCNSSDLNEDLGQVEVLFSDKTGTLTENKMLFRACSINGSLFRSVSDQLYEQPDGLCYMPKLNVARKLSTISVNRYAALANDLLQSTSPRSVTFKSALVGGSRSSRSSLDLIARLPAHQRPFDHRVVPTLNNLKLMSDSLDKDERVAEFLIAICLCSTISLNEQISIKDCLPDKNAQFDYQSASPDEQSLISAAALFGVVLCKSSERECFIAIKRPLSMVAHKKTSPTPQPSHLTNIKGSFKPLTESKYSTDKFIVRHFERLITFEFNSVRKKMSVLYKDCDNDCLVMFTKGSESVLDCIEIGSSSKAKSPISSTSNQHHHQQQHLPTHKKDKIINSTLAHFEAFSKSGLRTMLVGRRLLTSQEYDNVKVEMHDIRLMSSPENRDQRLTQLYKRVENHINLIGATAVEDSLQEGVPETIAHLKEAGIKVWLLTGDKVETAVSVAYLCKLLDRNMNLLNLVRQQDYSACKDMLISFAAQIKSALLYGEEEDYNTTSVTHDSLKKRPKSPSGNITSKQSLRSKISTNEKDMPRFALIVDGRSLHYAMKYAKQDLEYVSTNCVCVLGCRLSPLQKAEIVDMIKNSTNEPITAAIGDGANDVSMIQEAHVGIGVSGKEGRQAVNSSDFAINRFYMLRRLFFVHGHLFYHRTANIIHYFFYKNILFIIPQFLYSFYNLSSATSLYEPIMLIAYNMLFTSFPILFYGLFERNIPDTLLECYPRLYTINSRNKKMAYKEFIAWLSLGSIQALISFYFIYFIWGSHTPFLESGKMAGTIGFSSILFTSLVYGATLKLYFISKNRSFGFDMASIFSIACVPVILYLCSLIDLSSAFDNNSLYRHFATLAKSPTYWLAIITSTIASIVPDMILYVREQALYHRMLKSLITSKHAT